MSKRPNVLILMSDEHRADMAGFVGDQVVRTPTLDWLAESGVVFNNAYTPSPICVPARQCIMAGQYPSSSGCELFHHDLDPGHMTYARQFAQYGYSTVCAGKLHHQGVDQMQGWTRRVGGDVELSNEFTVRHEGFQLETDYSRKWSDAKEIIKSGVGRGPHQTDDQFALQGALNFIHKFFVDGEYDSETPHAPLLLKVSFCRPHYPYFTDQERLDYYLDKVQPFQGQKLFDHEILSAKSVVPGVDVSHEDIRRAVAAYYGMIDSMDADYGKVLDALRAAGQDLDDWIIVYLSDHGEMLGEHGVWEKFKFFEGSVRVPFVIRWPAGLEGNRTLPQNVNLCDLFATLCELCEIPISDDLDSRSLAPMLRDAASFDWDNVSYSEFGGEQLMIKRDALKYQWYGPELPDVLFDLEEDPNETKNFIDDDSYREVVVRFREERIRYKSNTRVSFDQEVLNSVD